MPSMLRSLVAAALAGAGAGAAAPELHCLGGVAHTVTYSGEGPPEEVNVVVQPNPALDAECKRRGVGVGSDFHLCLGANVDKTTCASASRPVLPLPGGARCQNCFVGAETDVFFTLNRTGLDVHSIGLGLRGVALQGTLQLEDDEGKATRDRKGSITLLSKIHEFKVKLPFGHELDIKVGMPTELHYEVQAWENGHIDLGLNFDLDLGDHYVEWQRGQGWVRHNSKAQLHLKGIHEGDYNTKANFTMGAHSKIQAEIGKMMWFHLDVAPEFPVSLTSIGASGADDIHSCVQVGKKFDLSHEAEIDLSIFNHSIAHRHWGPHTDRHVDGNLISKCKDVHPRRPHETEVQCVGGAAHTVTYSGPGPLDEVNMVVQPTPALDAQCAGDLGVGRDRQICVGVNTDQTCAAAKHPVLPLPGGARCQNCFVGAETDVFFSLNRTGLDVHSIGLGVKGTTLRGTLQLEDDEGKATRDRKGSITILSKIHEFKVKLPLGLGLDIKFGMPTEIHYDVQAWENGHGDLGVNFELDIGDHYVEWVRGQGWSVHKSKAKLHVKAIHEVDYNTRANITFGTHSKLQAEIGKMLWFHLDVAPEMPLSLSSVGTTGGDDLHNCLFVGRKFDLSHEAELDLSIFNHSIAHRHWGPHTDRHSDGSVINKCSDIHPRPPVAGTIVV